jgi:TolB-like protein
MTGIREQLQAGLGGRYVVERELGHGGMASVFLARDPRHDRQVAIKVLRPDVSAFLGIERFLREIRLAATLTHPHILPLHDSGAAGNLLYYVMPFLEGESIRDRLNRDGALAPEEAIRLVREVADALEYAHQHGVIHRDIKPENILLSSGHAVVADFGIARAVDAAADSRITEVGAAVGSPMYMSPEQAAGEPTLDGRSDVYSLGCVLFEMVAGRPPFQGPSSQAIMVSRLLETPPPLRTLQPAASAGLESAMARALARDPAARFGSAAEFSSALIKLETNVPPPAKPANERTSIAVLPFANLSREPDTDYFSDGMADELMAALSRIPALRVAARTSCYTFRGKDTDVRQIGRLLGVDAAVEGSVRKAGNRIRLNVQLIDTASGYHIWSESYDRDMGDVFALQEELARTIAGALHLKLLGTEVQAARVQGTRNLDAYTLYLRGRYHASLRTREGLIRGIAYFDQAIAADPVYTLAYAELGACWALRSFPEFGDYPPLEGMPLARAAVDRAIQLDPESGVAYAWRGVVEFLHDWAWDKAEASLRRSIELTPEYPLSHAWLANVLAVRLRFDESIASIERALALDPLSLTIQLLAGRCYFWAGRYPEALRYVRAILEVDPRQLLAAVWRSRILRHLEGVEAAHEALVAAVQDFGRDPRILGELAVTDALLGRREEAEAFRAELRDSALFGAAEAALGNFDAALAEVERGLAQRAGTVLYVPLNYHDIPSLATHPGIRARFAEIGVDFPPATPKPDPAQGEHSLS